ncbi:MAG: hypothetical protein ACM3ZA_07830 [Bacillota bacterium]
MKLTIIGAGGLRTPLLIQQLAESGVCTEADDVVLYDINAHRLEIVGFACRAAMKRAGGRFRLQLAATAEEAVRGSDFMILTIRAGFEEGRVKDERIALELGVLGQENTGPGGFSMALRNIPAVLEYAHLAERLAPNAWIINFTNPAGIVTRALLSQTPMRTIGICDTPSSLARQIAKNFGVASGEVQMEYFGLNHLGWVRQVLVRGQDRSAEARRDLSKIMGREMFNPDVIEALGLIPNEYLYFYYHRDRALGNILESQRTRGEEILVRTEEILKALQGRMEAGDEAGALDLYQKYIEQRDASYMSIETGKTVTKGMHMADGGYGGVAIAIIEAVFRGKGRVIIADHYNHGAIEGLADDDVIEGNFVINSNGVFPLKCGHLPYECKGLLNAGAAYERAVAEAAVTGSRTVALKALLLHPIGLSYGVANELVNRYLDAHQSDLPQFASAR